MNRRIPISNRIIVLNVLFTLFLAVIALGVYTLATKEIAMEDGTPMPAAIRYFMIAAVSLVGVGIVNIVFSVWTRVFTGRGAMTLTDRGIEDTFVIFSILAFWTTLNIRLIPWDAVDYDLSIPDMVTVDVKKLPARSAGTVAKFMLRFTGFNVRIGKIDEKEIVAIKSTIFNGAVNLEEQEYIRHF